MASKPVFSSGNRPVALNKGFLEGEGGDRPGSAQSYCCRGHDRDDGGWENKGLESRVNLDGGRRGGGGGEG